MKSTQFWVRRFLWVTGIVTMILIAAALLRGRSLDTALSESFTWALVAAAIFTGSRYYQARKGIACALCKDTVDTAGETTPSSPGVSSDIRTRPHPSSVRPQTIIAESVSECRN
ncbi:MAG: hypothetical protein JWR40_3601 [Massilia sp.]|jgi:hypothetical protein|nr:hypothetical protein [Massilia sp.]